MKKILFVHPDLRGGGAEKVLVNMINSLDVNKYQIILLTIFEEGINKEILSNRIKHKYVFKKVFRGWSLIQKLFSPKNLFNNIIKDEYDLIVAYLEGVPTRIVGGCNVKHTKTVSWVHVDLNGFNIEKLFKSKKEMNEIYLKYDAIVGVSQTALKSLQKKIPALDKNKLHVIHNVVDINLIISDGNKNVDDITFITKNNINLCSVGRLANQKGYIRLFNILAKLVKENFNFHFYLIGEGEHKEKLSSIIANEKLENHITLLGFKNNPHKYVKKCDLFVCSSYQEGFSTAVTESILLGTPVITTNCAGMEEILVNGLYGKIVDNSDEALYEGLKELLSNTVAINNYKVKVKKRSEDLQKKNNINEIENFFDTLLLN
ncbi:glycosyltransferase [Thalassobellus sediminis]|uniref:glycosyltransferase n=1 Tax=Thalassobellus sediminis TaxID=3367753 RepID=UPI00379646CA